ncbi:DUF2085 domain-containing protein [Brevibacillus migulae]|uniref:DUF2085 domain-containing protein n=1 Tax=Brevibacillus migulae TaxID=1644114 RepID=UPI00196B4A6B|nr:DUF2085 domain-containing protein [Brevibacillus migulae]
MIKQLYKEVATLSFMPCHRLPARSFHFRGKPFPVCARCTGILLGFFGVPLLVAVKMLLPLWLGIMLHVPMLVDGVTQQKGWRVSNNPLRLITGLLSGMGLAILAVTGAVRLARMLMHG